MTARKSKPEKSKKRPYHPPKVTVHGDLRAMTKSKGGSSSDGSGKPATRAFGSNA